MPVRNGLPFLTECIESILNQTFTNWELIAVDDHSTDNTFDYLKSISISDKRISVAKNTSKGIIKALKTGFNISKGKYITRMDADDLMPLNKLGLMLNALLENQNSVITGKVQYINNLGEGYINYQNWLNNLVDNNNHYSEIYKECVVASPCWMMEKTLFEQCGSFNSETYPEDYDLVFRWYEKKVPVIGLQETLHIWRDHNSRASRNDDNYSDNSFLKLKLKYFFRTDFDNTKTLFLWGAGNRAKNVAKLIISNNKDFLWCCNNNNKIGRKIYEKTMFDINELLNNDNTLYQTIITISNPEEQKEIKELLKSKPNIQPFWFC